MDTKVTGTGDKLLIGRQPILDRQQRIVAYELLFRSGAPATGMPPVDGVLATSQVLVNTFNHLGLDEVLGDKRAFINVSAEFLARDVLELLPAKRVVLEILESVKPTPEVVERARGLVNAGFEIALDDFVYTPEWEPLIALARHIKIDIRAQGMRQTAAVVARLRGRGPALLAEKVENMQETNACQDLGFEHFQGYYFAKPEVLSTRRLDPSVQNAMSLFNLVIGKADLARIEAGFRNDVALTYNLLRFINSVGMGLTHKVTQVRHALVVLGHAKLARWLSLLLMSYPGANVAPHALFRTALARARLAEILGQKRLGAQEQDMLFITGMFSLLDALLGKPLAEVLGSLTLPPEVSEALLKGSGPLAPYLKLVLAIERGEEAAVDAAARQLGVGYAELGAAQAAALGWAEQMGSVG
jgi:EAL and modified HD-GYP domain-containing signal transduction protein